MLDYLQARAAGRMLRDAGTWDRPVRVPDALADCRHGGRRSLRSLAGQRLRIAVPEGSGPQRALGEDPRLVTLLAHADHEHAHGLTGGMGSEMGQVGQGARERLTHVLIAAGAL